MIRNVLLPGLVLALCACSDPVAPDREQLPEPKAAAGSASGDSRLAAAIDAPLDRARDAQAAVDAAAIARREALEQAEAGTDATSAAAP